MILPLTQFGGQIAKKSFMAGSWSLQRPPSPSRKFDISSLCVIFLILLICRRTSIALLQLQPVLSHPFLRTIVILACIFSAASLANSSALHALKKRLDCDTIRLRWLDASRYPKKNSSTDFWVCISSPLTFLGWLVFQLSDRWKCWNNWILQVHCALSRNHLLALLGYPWFDFLESRYRHPWYHRVCDDGNSAFHVLPGA